MAERQQIQVVYNGKEDYYAVPVKTMNDAISNIVQFMDPLGGRSFVHEDETEFVHVIVVDVVTGSTLKYMPQIKNLKLELVGEPWSKPVEDRFPGLI